MWKQNPCSMFIRQIHLALTKESDNALRKHSLTMSQLVFLMLVRNSPGKELALKDLKRFLRVSQPDIAGLALRLEKKGMVVIFTEAADRRVKRAKITPLAEQCCMEAEASMADVEGALLSGMTAEERGAFQALLEKAMKNFS